MTELDAKGVDVEKSLQSLVEKHLEGLLGVRFLASEYSTGPAHGGRIDTLGVDENGSPVIVEYKRNINQNVINQGLFYLDWLLDHKGEFELLVNKQLGPDDAAAIEWSSPRLICVAGDFTRYDEHAVQQINRNIELLRYRQYDAGNLLLLELVNAATGKLEEGKPTGAKTAAKKYTTVTEMLGKAEKDLTSLYESLRDYCEELGDDVAVNTLEYYIAFRRLKNFACVELRPKTGELLVFVKVDPDSLELEEGFTRDVRDIGHYGTGDLEIRIGTANDLDKAKPLLTQSYEAS